MNPKSLNLTIEQEFALRTYESQLPNLSPQEAQKLLLDVMRQLMIKENIIKDLMRQVL